MTRALLRQAEFSSRGSAYTIAPYPGRRTLTGRFATTSSDPIRVPDSVASVFSVAVYTGTSARIERIRQRAREQEAPPPVRRNQGTFLPVALLVGLIAMTVTDSLGFSAAAPWVFLGSVAALVTVVSIAAVRQARKET